MIRAVKNQSMLGLVNQLQSLAPGDTRLANRTKLTFTEMILDALSYQMPQSVEEYVSYKSEQENFYHDYELCPRCGGVLTRTYQAYCDKCGQRLHWISRSKMKWKK